MQGLGLGTPPRQTSAANQCPDVRGLFLFLDVPTVFRVDLLVPM